MNKRIVFFAKVFDNKTYADDFIQGKLFSNRLSFFRKLEENENANRGDKYEGIVSWYQPDQIQVKINDRIITDLAAPVSIQMNWHEYLNIFRIYSAHSGDFNEITSENLDAFRKQLELPDDCQKLGEHTVLVTNVPEFIKRIEATVDKNNYGLTASLVEYYDPETFHGSFNQRDSIFKKRDEFKHQKEFRFAFDTGSEGEDPLVLEIGDITDITMRCNTSDINKNLEIKLPERS